MRDVTSAEFDTAVAPFRAELHAHCYRMIGSIHDADDALQDALVAAWKNFATFEGRGTLRAWLYKIATNAALALIAKRPRRMLSIDYAPPHASTDLLPPITEPMWVEPYADAGAQLAHRESIELAFVAAIQYLPANQRAALLLRDVLGFSAEEAAEVLDTSVASITSALQRGRATVAERVPPTSQQATLQELGDSGARALVTAFSDAWHRADVPALIALLARDAKFSMPPIPCWFHGHEAIARFLSVRVFETAWRLVPAHANGQLALMAYQGPTFTAGAIQVLTLRGGQISEITAFLDPAIQARFGL